MTRNGEIQFPIFVRAKDCGDVTKYSSVHDLQHDVEQIDVENDEHDAWDSSGLRLSLGIQKPLWLRVEARENMALPTELSAAISEYAQKNGIALQSSNLVAGKYSEALEQVENGLNKQKLTSSWSQKFFGRARK